MTSTPTPTLDEILYTLQQATATNLLKDHPDFESKLKDRDYIRDEAKAAILKALLDAKPESTCMYCNECIEYESNLIKWVGGGESQ